MELLSLGVLGGLLALDGTSVGQFMISRPLVAGALAGWLLGAPDLGIALGVILELYLIVSVPAGGAKFPEGSVATVVAVASATPFGGFGALPLGLAFGLLWGQIAGMSVSALRHFNVRLVPEAEHDSGASLLAGRHFGAIGVDLIRGIVVTIAGVWLGRVVLGAVVESWPLTQETSRAIVLVGGLVSAGILINDLGGLRRRGVWFAVGLIVAVAGSAVL